MASWQDIISQFHWLRPWWLLALVPLGLLWWQLWRARGHNSRWSSIIPAPLLQYLLETETTANRRWPLYGLATAWLLGTLALAGPTWERLPQPVHRSQAAMVILLDLSPSMVARDLNPSRLVRARYKLTDLLQERREGLTALIAYAGEAHVVSPLTDDTATITNLLPVLSPELMPLRGSNIEMAMAQALTLFDKAQVNRGDILVVTDGIVPAAFKALEKQLADQPFRLSVLGVGTPEGAPIPSGDGGFLKDNQDQLVVAKLNEDELQQLANKLGGHYQRLGSQGDLQQLTQFFDQQLTEQETQLSNRQFDNWRDAGQWLALLLLPFAALAFRRGWLLSLAGVICFFPSPSQALEWQDLWLTPDQQGQQQLQQGQPEAAAENFHSPAWRGTALYQADDYQTAAQAFAQDESVRGHYNRGNALAKAGDLEAAIEAYEQALALQPEHEDAAFNKQLVEELLAQQGQGEGSENQAGESHQQQEDQQQADSQQSGQNQSDQGESSQDSTQQEQADSEQAEQQNAQSSTDDSVDEEAAQQLAERSAEKEEQEQQEQQEQQSAQAQQAMEESDDTDDNPEQTGDAWAQQQSETMEREDAERQQSFEQWLRQIPDDPGGLLRRKFEHQHRQLRREYRRGDWTLPENQAYERW